MGVGWGGGTTPFLGKTS